MMDSNSRFTSDAVSGFPFRCRVGGAIRGRGPLRRDQSEILTGCMWVIRKYLRSVRERARATRQRAAVITFDPAPDARFCIRRRAPLMIQTLAQRLEGFEQMGLDAALVLRFDRALSQVTAEEFIEQISGREACAPEPFWWARISGSGTAAQGMCEMLENMRGTQRFRGGGCSAGGGRTGRIVSSTAIRAAVACGDVAGAIALSGAPVFTDRRNSERRRARADDPVPHLEPCSRAGVAARSWACMRPNPSSARKTYAR